MFIWKNKKSVSHGNLKHYIKSYTFQRMLAGLITLIFAFVIVETGAAPKKYKLFEGTSSAYDIYAPRDIENKLKTEQNAEAAAAAVSPVMKEVPAASAEVYKSVEDFIMLLEEARRSIIKKMDETGLDKKEEAYAERLEKEREYAVDGVSGTIKKMDVPLSVEQIRYLVYKASDEELYAFSRAAREVIINAMKDDITEESLLSQVNRVQNELQSKEINQDFKNIGNLLVKAIIKPNRTVDVEATKKRREEAYNRQSNVVKIPKGSRIISVGETVTEDKLRILAELNLLETTRRFDFAFAAGILFILLLLGFILILYMNRFCKNVLHSRDDIFILCLLILLTLGIARWAGLYSPMAVPVFIAAMTISILLDLRLAVIVNFVLTVAVALMTRGSLSFIYMSLISGTISAFLVSKANQRSSLSAAGLITGLINVLVVVCFGLVSKSGIKEIGIDSLIVFLNGIISVVLTIGMLPFWESTFNVITPLKLLELANPNQALLKRLLMEAPGTYHHSLMVGNLAEVATEAIGGDALLARVGAYFHDVGKLTRPNFFKENQMGENPHDRITPNLSTLIITSHTSDGVELAKKHKIPAAIRDIISQHHGNTLVAFFYHKAKSGEKGDQVKQENFRYEGPRPSSKEAAVVMLADSVEAAVRSMPDKTEGKIEGLVRKIIKDKLDDGQLDLCDLTLKDMDIIAKSFLRVFSGFFHERQKYPEIKSKRSETDELVIGETGQNQNSNEEKEEAVERKIPNGNIN